MSIEAILLVIGAYLFGSIPAAYLAAKWSRGIDLRRYGTGNVGLGNLWEMTSKRVTIPVVLFDLGKGAGMIWMAQLLGLGIDEQVALGLAAIIGHNWPVFLRFNGGRGILTTLGVIFVLMPWGIVAFLAAAAFTLLTRSSPLPVLAGIIGQPLVSYFTGKPLSVTLGLVVILVIVIIRRLTAPRTTDTPISKRRLFFNRLFFDRDISDREAWIYRVPPGAPLTEDEEARLQKKRQKKGLFHWRDE